MLQNIGQFTESIDKQNSTVITFMLSAFYNKVAVEMFQIPLEKLNSGNESSKIILYMASD